MEGCKETQCTSCEHRLVCKNTDLFLKVVTAVDKVSVTDDDGVYKILDIPWIRPEVYCENYLRKSTI